MGTTDSPQDFTSASMAGDLMFVGLMPGVYVGSHELAALGVGSVWRCQPSAQIVWLMPGAAGLEVAHDPCRLPRPRVVKAGAPSDIEFGQAEFLTPRASFMRWIETWSGDRLRLRRIRTSLLPRRLTTSSPRYLFASPRLRAARFTPACEMRLRAWRAR